MIDPIEYSFPHQDINPDCETQRYLAEQRRRKQQREEREEKVILQYIDSFADGKFKGVRLHEADKEYYQKRAKLYLTITERLATLDPVRDYSERNGINHKRTNIKQDFRDMLQKKGILSKSEE